MSKKYPRLNNKEWLYQQYCIKKLSTTKIAHIINCNDTTVWRALKELDISIRTRKEALTKYFELNNKEWLEEEYLVKKLSARQIAEIVGCASSTVREALKRVGIKSRTISESKKGEMNPRFGKHGYMYGKHHSKETKAKLREANKNPSEETRQKLREVHKGKHHTEAAKKNMREAKKNTSEETRAKLREARKHRKFPTIDTKPELIFINFYNKFGIADRVKDTRDNSFHIGRLNPDFVIPDMKIAIFVNGDYWHSALLKPNLGYTQQPENQMKICKRHKWKAVIIWGTDLLREDAEQFVLSVLRKEKII